VIPKANAKGLALLITQAVALAKNQLLFLEDSVRQTPRPVRQLVSPTGKGVSYLDWVTGPCSVFAPRDGSNH
jgi:hypothetical protein